MRRAEDHGVQDGTPRVESHLAGPESSDHTTGSGFSRAGPSSTIHHTTEPRRRRGGEAEGASLCFVFLIQIRLSM